MDQPSLEPLTATSGRVVALPLKSANKYIFRALLSLASAALLIRVMGLLNQFVVSGRFGAGATMDAYFVSVTPPLLLAQLIIWTIEASVIPIYAAIRTQAKKEQVSQLFSTLLNLLLIGGALLTLVMLLFREQLVHLSAPALDPFRTGLAIQLTPFIYPVLVLTAVIGFLECILNTEGQFGWPAYAGCLVPLTTAILVLVAGASQGVVMLCVGMVVGLCLQLCVIIVRIRRTGLVYRPIMNLRNPAIGSILAAAWPVLMGSLIGQANPFIDQIFASFLSTGSISALNYSLKLTSVFSGVIFSAAGRAMLPHLSRQASLKDLKGFKETLRLQVWTVGIGIFVLSALMLVLAHPLVQILFQRGAFSADDTGHTASTLIGFVIGLTPMALNFITVRAFSALGKTRILVFVSIFNLIVNAIFDYIFAHFWQSQGIAVATSTTYFCAMFIQFFVLRRMLGKLHLFTLPPGLLKVKWKQLISQYYQQWVTWKVENLPVLGIPDSLRRQIVCIGIVVAIFTAGATGILLNSLYTLRIALGLVVMLALLRYPYVLLIVWVLINGPNALPILRGSNVLIALTVPTLLLMPGMPIKQTFKRMPALAFLLIYLLWVFASIRISAIGVEQFLTQWALYLDCAAVGILTVNMLTTRRRIMGLIDATLLVSTFISLYGIYGYITKQNGTFSPETGFRIFSIFGSSPTLALFLSLVIPLALYRTLTLRGFKCFVCALVILIFLVALGLTFTRGTFISVPFSIIIMVSFLPFRKLKIRLLIGIAALAILTVLLATVGQVPIFTRFFGQDITTLNGRTYLWQAILDHFDPIQLLGNGLNASDLLLTDLHVGVNNRGLISTSPHSLFLATLYNHGIIGLILLTLVFIRLVANLITGIRKASDDHRMLFAMALAVFVSVLLQSLDSNDFWNQAISIYIWVIMALPFATCWSTPEQAFEADEDFFRWGNSRIP